MEKKTFLVIQTLLKALVMAYSITMAVILILALILYKFTISENIVRVVLVGTYIIVCFIAGLYSGKQLKTRRFLWGILIGIIYFCILQTVSWIEGNNAFTIKHGVIALICMASGMLGGMFG